MIADEEKDVAADESEVCVDSSPEREVSASVSEASVVTEDAKTVTQTAKKKKVERQYQEAWGVCFPWLKYEKEEGAMYCSLCIAAKVVKNSFTQRLYQIILVRMTTS